MTTKQLSFACLGAGLVALLGLLVGLADPACYAPETTLDYAGASFNTLGPRATALTRANATRAGRSAHAHEHGSTPLALRILQPER